MLALSDYLVLSALLFSIGMAGIFLNRKNAIVLLMSIELILLAVNFNFIAFSSFLGDIHGQVFVFFILTVAAAESAIGLAILVVLFRNRGSINVGDLDTMRG
ncbi:NADH:ubiquinone oxidoreductase subunit K [Spiribacter salinus M19-40]|jgi:NADH-quinone oxidoreductase subunit K|uniref:NADH-quinone oxidoreductase subunit K n=2 Tax=Spiribacter salinus TaxID=1335746 RepID=R4VMD5_9GAMM|nr:NADH-quinone oxidoreductase subunit NuoK [Spiribacter salinus]MDR9413705.1 NADH-quinone oxidoreductase subunit NuoK [Spiribacter sp.]AGM40723.1 NADH:ubiquinone oxidoreductase subunit K [Spiribacter salinus M19-40]MBY5267950.1 NADH-quinone oxidoreductase subunit K [Spiribacter salinus]MDR9454154.1 NADH-quinone oxidoreductase subunit NuoK [Spiribacter sp.]TQE99978.1 MAG: NADH-quinone oxidoreductase subunit NuoK [Spiribacter salinus]